MLVDHAEMELRAAGLYDDDSDYGGMMPGAVLELIKVFAEQGHSGGSAPICIDLFRRLAMYEPLVPLTGNDYEWFEYMPGHWQNKRCSHVFKDSSGAYDIEGKVFREPNGCCYTNMESRVPVTFPYTPKREYVDVVCEDGV